MYLLACVQSLLGLRRVILTLAEAAEQGITAAHIPYRETKLTRVLQAALVSLCVKRSSPPATTCCDSFFFSQSAVGLDHDPGRKRTHVVCVHSVPDARATRRELQHASLRLLRQESGTCIWLVGGWWVVGGGWLVELLFFQSGIIFSLIGQVNEARVNVQQDEKQLLRKYMQLVCDLRAKIKAFEYLFFFKFEKPRLTFVLCFRLDQSMKESETRDKDLQKLQGDYRLIEMQLKEEQQVVFSCLNLHFDRA